LPSPTNWICFICSSTKRNRWLTTANSGEFERNIHPKDQWSGPWCQEKEGATIGVYVYTGHVQDSVPSYHHGCMVCGYLFWHHSRWTTQEPNLLAKALATSFFNTAYMFQEMQTTFTLTLNISSRPSYFHLILPMWLCEWVKYDI